MTRYVYEFADGDRDMADLLGGKGANLAEMTRLGLPVPPGFTVTTTACRAYLATGEEPGELGAQVVHALAELERSAGRELGGRDNPLLLSVRSGSKFSMPGMMETTLGIGLDYVSCSPFRVPAARLEAGRASLADGRDGASASA